MKKLCVKMFYLAIGCILSVICLHASEGSSNEFVQPKKQQKRVSLDVLRKNNIEICSNIFECSASVVEGLGQFQKQLKYRVDELLQKDTRTYHEHVEQQLTQVTNLLHQIEDLLTTCQKCLQG